MMSSVYSATGAVVPCLKAGAGPPLLLVHGSFSDALTNWEFVLPILEQQFTVYAIARRGRNGAGATTGHTVEQEALDILAVAAEIGEPAFLLGHSFGAVCALAAAAHSPAAFRKLIVYEPPLPTALDSAMLEFLERIALRRDWDGFATTFFREVLRVPPAELDPLRDSPLWPPIVADAPASLEDLRALARHRLPLERLRGLDLPVLLQVGSESPAELFASSELFDALPCARVEVLTGQAHEAMTTAPDLYAKSVAGFLLDSPGRPGNYVL